MIKNNYSKYCINSESTMKNAIKKLNFLVPKFCLVVNDNRSFLGILTDGDIRRGLLKNNTINDKIINIINRKTIITKTKLSRPKINHILKNKGINANNCFSINNLESKYLKEMVNLMITGVRMARDGKICSIPQKNNLKFSKGKQYFATHKRMRLMAEKIIKFFN